MVNLRFFTEPLPAPVMVIHPYHTESRKWYTEFEGRGATARAAKLHRVPSGRDRRGKPVPSMLVIGRLGE